MTAPRQEVSRRRPDCAGLRDALAGRGGMLGGVGLDAEAVARFERLADSERFRRRVYTAREAEHLASQAQPSLAFCAAFCCKEAFCKALGAAYSFPECEFLHPPGASEVELAVSPRLAERHDIAGALARLHPRFLGRSGECVVEVRVFRRATDSGGAAHPPAGRPATARGTRSSLEALTVAAVEAERPQVEARHFSPPELDHLRGRRIQSLAGFLALKRALAALWTAAGAPAEPRDFELSHHASGAPRLVAAPKGPAPADVFVSISHTRRQAYGLAVIGGRVPPGGPPVRLLY